MSQITATVNSSAVPPREWTRGRPMGPPEENGGGISQT